MTDPRFEGTRYLMIVQRGQSELFLSLRNRLEPAEQIQVVWDRREVDRRHDDGTMSGDRRQGDRRQTDLVGTLVGFLLALPVPPAGAAPPAA